MASDAVPASLDPTSPQEHEPPQDLRDRLVAAGLEILRLRGPADLTMRRIAEAAGTSTMGVYTRFGGRAEILTAIYRHGFVLLWEALDAVGLADDPTQHILDLGLAYRRFALANRALYALLFERPVPDFDPTPEARREALSTTFGPLVAAVCRLDAPDSLPARDPERAAYLVWCTLHGIVSIELTCSGRSPLPGWFLDTTEIGEQVLVDGTRAILAGLTTAAP